MGCGGLRVDLGEECKARPLRPCTPPGCFLCEVERSGVGRSRRAWSRGRNLGHSSCLEPPPGGSWGRWRGVDHQSTWAKTLPRVHRWGYGGASGGTLKGESWDSGQEFPLTSWLGHWFGLETCEQAWTPWWSRQVGFGVGILTILVWQLQLSQNASHN